jgi:SWI/SNF-related matrix-associated actin-dependent regulator 1 of chromatin subfamily A
LKSVEKIDDTLVVKFYVPNAQFSFELGYIKGFKGRKFDAEKKCWVIPYSYETICDLKSHGYTLSHTLQGLMEDATKQEYDYTTPSEEIDPTKMLSSLREYQQEGLEFLEAVNGRGIVSFSMRMGKSLTALAWCLYKDIRRILIICPAIAKPVWEQEIKKWTDLRYFAAKGRTAHSIDKRVEVIIINYDILSDWLPILEFWDAKALIVDESHYAANKTRMVSKKQPDGTNKSVKEPVKRTVAVTSLGRKIQHTICLSGTPITSYPSQFFPVLNMLYPNMFPNEWKYLHRYCDPVRTQWGWEFKGASNVNELRSKLSKIMIRKTKQDAFNELPDEERIVLPIEIDMKAYEREWGAFQEWYKEHRGLSDEELDQKIAHLESIAYPKKRATILEWVQEFLKSGEQLIIFAWFRETCFDLHTAFKKESVLVYGGTKDRDAQVQKFQKGDARIFIGQISAVKEAITLANANTALYVELPWSAGDLRQSEERLFLPGNLQKNAYFYAIAQDTIDEERYHKLQERVENLDRVLDGKSNAVVS